MGFGEQTLDKVAGIIDHHIKSLFEQCNEEAIHLEPDSEILRARRSQGETRDQSSAPMRDVAIAPGNLVNDAGR
jgi:hypothetical protein